MTFYQELQLSSTGSKQLIKSTTDPKEKRRHILIYNFKVYLVMAFCVAVVSMYSKLTGSSNSVVGVLGKECKRKVPWTAGTFTEHLAGSHGRCTRIRQHGKLVPLRK